MVEPATGRQMVEGEFEAMSLFYSTVPALVPKPQAWGKMQDGSGRHFYICEFLDLDNLLPDPTIFCSLLAQAHRRSKSPTGMFGFHVSTCHGRIPQPVDWDPSWQSFFTKLLRHWFKADFELNGAWPAFEEAKEQMLSNVIPKLLGSLKDETHVVEPVLIHGDLGHHNVCHAGGGIYIYDAEAYYAHHEMELGIWRWTDNKLSGSAYLDSYLQQFPASEPVEQFDDRNRLYCAKFYMSQTAHFRGLSLRQTC